VAWRQVLETGRLEELAPAASGFSATLFLSDAETKAIPLVTGPPCSGEAE